MSKKKKTGELARPQFERQVERYFYELNMAFPGSRILYAIFLGFAFFGVMGLVWMIPFPQLGFLARLEAQNYLNWGSFFIAIVIYSYLKLSPTLSYAMLLTIGVFSYFIVQLEYLERDYGLSATLVFGLTTILSLLGLLVLGNLNRTGAAASQPGINFWLKLLAIGPIWIWSSVFAIFNWKLSEPVYILILGIFIAIL